MSTRLDEEQNEKCAEVWVLYRILSGQGSSVLWWWHCIRTLYTCITHPLTDHIYMNLVAILTQMDHRTLLATAHQKRCISLAHHTLHTHSRAALPPWAANAPCVSSSCGSQPSASPSGARAASHGSAFRAWKKHIRPPQPLHVRSPPHQTARGLGNLAQSLE